jgi:hypothetical protein
MRTLLKITIALVALLAATWMGIFFYWQFSVGREIRILRGQTSTNYDEVTPEQLAAASRLQVLGCRALPRLIAALHPSEEAGFLNAASYVICSESWYIDHRENDDESERYLRMAGWQILPQDSEATKRRKIELMGEWWRGHVPAHPWWRVWSDVCLRPTR